VLHVIDEFNLSAVEMQEHLDGFVSEFLFQLSDVFDFICEFHDVLHLLFSVDSVHCSLGDFLELVENVVADLHDLCSRHRFHVE